MMETNQSKRHKDFNDRRLKIVKQQLEPELSQVFGYNALLYTPLAHSLTNNNLIIKNQIVIAESRHKTGLHAEESLLCRFDELPIASDCIDLAILPNVLDNSLHPHEVLREAERVMIPEGVIILIGRNPYSWYGLKSRYLQWRDKNEFGLSAISKRRVIDWFSLLGLEVQKQLNISLTDQQIQNSGLFFGLKSLSKMFCRCFCSYYIIIATKKVSTLTPIRPSWRSNKNLVPSRLAEPSVRAQVENMFQRVK